MVGRTVVAAATVVDVSIGKVVATVVVVGVTAVVVVVGAVATQYRSYMSRASDW